MMTWKPYAVAAAPGPFRSARRNATPVALEGKTLAEPGPGCQISKGRCRWESGSHTTTLQLLFFEKFSKLAGISAT